MGVPHARHFCWAARAGIQHGSLLLERDKRPPSDLEYLQLDMQLPPPLAEPVLSMVRCAPHACMCPRLSMYHEPLQPDADPRCASIASIARTLFAPETR